MNRIAVLVLSAFGCVGPFVGAPFLLVLPALGILYLGTLSIIGVRESRKKEIEAIKVRERIVDEAMKNLGNRIAAIENKTGFALRQHVRP